MLSTFWLQLDAEGSDSTDADSSVELSESFSSKASLTMQTNFSRIRQSKCEDIETRNRNLENQRLVEWNTELLKHLLSQVLARRSSKSPIPDQFDEHTSLEKLRKGKNVFDEVKETIDFPKESEVLSRRRIQLSSEVLGQMKSFVSEIAKRYPANPFHSFKHASHVVVALSKLLTQNPLPCHGGQGSHEGMIRTRIHGMVLGVRCPLATNLQPSHRCFANFRYTY